jgi:hypothetical protein
MANSNIATIQVTNTFDEWRIATGVNLVNDRNTLRNGSYVKDGGDFKINNGVLRVAKAGDGTVVVVEGNGNVVVGGNVTASNITVTSDATVGNLVVLGVQTNVGDITNDSDLIVLRNSAISDGNGALRIKQPGSAANAEVRFNSTNDVWQATADANVGYSTILTTANLVDSVSSTSTINAATPNSVRTAYDLASAASSAAAAASLSVISAANTARISANGGSTLNSRQLNFVNTATVLVSVADGSGAAAGNANIAFTVIGGGGGGSVNSVSGTAGRITSSGGTDPVIDLATAGAGASSYSSGISALTVDAYGRVTSVTGSAGYVTTSGVTSVSGTTGRITSSGGATPTIDLATAGAGAATYSTGISSITVDAYGRVTSVSGSAGYITSGGVTISDQTSSSSTFYPILTTSTSGGITTASVSTTKLSFVPSTGLLSATDFAATSDARLKDVVGVVQNPIDKLEHIRGVEFLWNDTAKELGVSEDKELQVGVLAQEVALLYPSMVAKNEDGYMRVNYDKLVPVLIEAIKELSDRVKTLEGK